MNRTPPVSDRSAAEAIGYALTRRQMIGLGAIVLSSLAMARCVALADRFCGIESGRQAADFPVSQRDLDALSSCQRSLYRHGPQRRQPEHGGASMVHPRARPSGAYSDAAHDLEGKAHSSRQSGNRLDRQEARTGVYRQSGNNPRSGSRPPNSGRLSKEVSDGAIGVESSNPGDVRQGPGHFDKNHAGSRST